mgnify:CR=1 FL=1
MLLKRKHLERSLILPLYILRRSVLKYMPLKKKCVKKFCEVLATTVILKTHKGKNLFCFPLRSAITLTVTLLLLLL